MLKHILILCVGNVCRSPMAAALMDKRLQDRNRIDIEVRSAGVAALAGQPAAENARVLMGNLHVDLSDHRAQQVTDEMLNWADLILVMETSHLQSLHHRSPTSRGKIFLLGHWVAEEVPDPFMQDLKTFYKSFAVIEQGVEGWLDKIL